MLKSGGEDWKEGGRDAGLMSSQRAGERERERRESTIDETPCFAERQAREKLTGRDKCADYSSQKSPTQPATAACKMKTQLEDLRNTYTFLHAWNRLVHSVGA